jgi:hypothetical protein
MGLVGEGAAGEQAEEAPARDPARCLDPAEPGPHLPGLPEGTGRPGPAGEPGRRLLGRLVQGADPDHAVGGRALRPQTTHHHRLAGLRHGVFQGRHQGVRRRFGDHHDGLGPRVGRQGLQGEEGHLATDLFAQVPAAHADALGDALAQGGQAGDHRLQPGARGRDEAHAPRLHHVVEAEPDAVQIGGAAVRAHAQQAALERLVFQRHFVLDRHVVAEQEHVEAALEGAQRLGLGVGARDRNGRQIGVRQAPQGRVQGTRQDLGRLFGHLAPGGQQVAGRRKRGRGRRLVVPVHGHDQVVRAGRAALRRRQTDLVE